MANIGHYSLLVFCALCTVILITIDRVKKKGVFGNKLDVLEEVFDGGRLWVTRNSLFVALAVSSAFTPSVITENIYLCGIESICLLAARLVSLVLCVWVWSKIAQIGLNSMTSFIKFRYNSKFALILYLLNSVSCFIYIQRIYNGPLLYNLLEYFKLNTDGYVLLICFILLCGFGGMRIALPLCSLLTLVEIVGCITLMINLGEHNETIKEYDIHPCNSHNPFHMFGTVFPLLMTAQPLYRLYYGIGSQQKAMVAMGIGFSIFLFKFILAFLIARTILGYVNTTNLETGVIMQALYLDSPEVSASFKHSSDYLTRFNALDYLSTFVLNSLFYDPMAAFYCLQLCLLVSELGENIIPHLQRTLVKLTENEIQHVYCSLYCILACFLFISLLNADRNIEMPEYHHVSLYVPHIASIAMFGVTALIVLGILLPTLGLIYIFAAWGITILLTAVWIFTIIWNGYTANIDQALIDWDRTDHSFWLCIGIWANFFFLLIYTIVVMLLVCLSKGKRQQFLERTFSKSKPTTSLFQVMHTHTMFNYKIGVRPSKAKTTEVCQGSCSDGNEDDNVKKKNN